MILNLMVSDYKISLAIMTVLLMTSLSALEEVESDIKQYSVSENPVCVDGIDLNGPFHSKVE